MHSSWRTPAVPWAIRLYLTETGRNDFSKWNASLSTKGRARRDSNIKFLRFQPEERWRRPEAAALGNHASVIHFQDETTFQHRLFGYFDLENHAFVICVVGFEQGNKYHPKDYEQRIQQRRASVGDAFNKRTIPCPWPV